MINRVHLAWLPGGYIYMHASETCSSDRLQFTEELEKQTRPKHHREKDEVVMEIKLEEDYTISDTAEIRSFLHYCLEFSICLRSRSYLQTQQHQKIELSLTHLNSLESCQFCSHMPSFEQS